MKFFVFLLSILPLCAYPCDLETLQSSSILPKEDFCKFFNKKEKPMDEILSHSFCHDATVPKDAFVEPTSRTKYCLTYDLEALGHNNGISLESKDLSGESHDDAAYFHIPEDLRGYDVHTVTLSHRQSNSDRSDWECPGDAKSCSKKAMRDKEPGITLVSLFDENSNEHCCWEGEYSGSGTTCGKFAEPRSAGIPEIEKLYGWHYYGCKDPNTGQRKSNVRPSHIRVEAKDTTGKNDPVHLHMIKLCMIGEESKNNQKFGFISGIDMDNYNSYGVKESYRNMAYYENALALRFGGGNTEVKGWKQAGSRVSYPVDERVEYVELAAGDLKAYRVDVPSDIKNNPSAIANWFRTNVEPDKSGNYGKAGWGKIQVGIKRKSGKIIYFDKEDNVGPVGFHFSSPPESYEFQSGDEIFIEGKDDTVYLMGVKLAY